MFIESKKDIQVYPDGRLFFSGSEYRCALGKGGVKKDKHEGDGTTSIGCFPIREIFYRKDRLGELRFGVKTTPIQETDAWCDDENDERYNTLISIPRGEGTESFWREDAVYDIIVVLGYNDDPPMKGKGSAIFMHVARDGYPSTAGCIALSLKDLRAVLHKITPETKVCVMKK